VKATVYTNGWPDAANAFDGADAVIIYCDGGGKHPAVQENHKAGGWACRQRGRFSCRPQQATAWSQRRRRGERTGVSWGGDQG